MEFHFFKSKWLESNNFIWFNLVMQLVYRSSSIYSKKLRQTTNYIEPNAQIHDTFCQAQSSRKLSQNLNQNGS